MEVRRDSIPLQPRRIGLCRIENLIPGSDVLHPLLHVPRHLSNYAMVLVHGIARATPQGLGYLLWYELGHLEYQEKSAFTSEQVFPIVRGAECFLLAFG